MAGCCSAGDTQNCGWAKSCVPYDAYTKKSCDSDCILDPFVWKCSKSATPYCITWTYPGVGVADYACGTINSGVLTVLQTAEDEVSYYWKTLSTLSGNAVTGWGDSSSVVKVTTESSDIISDPSSADGSDATDSPTPRPQEKKSTPVGAIVGGVVGGLAALFLIGAAIIFFCVKQRKKKQLANNQNIIAAQQTHQPPPQSEFKPPMQQQYAPPAGVHSPPPQNGYFAAPAQDQKIGYQVQEQSLQSPVISSPSSPAPAYVQPYYGGSPNAPPIPHEEAAQYPPPAREATPGTYEVDAISSHLTSPASQETHARPVQPSNVYEMGGGR